VQTETARKIVQGSEFPYETIEKDHDRAGESLQNADFAKVPGPSAANPPEVEPPRRQKGSGSIDPAS
jgi:hypothetical protein